MECSALAACAQMRGIVWGEILYTADTLHDVENYDERNWGGDSKAYALELCIESVLRIWHVYADITYEISVKVLFSYVYDGITYWIIVLT